MKKLVITGYTSRIAIEFADLLQQRGTDVRILRCGRHAESDYRVDFSSYDCIRSFIEWLRVTRPDYLLLNHGILPGMRLSAMADGAIEQALRVNLVSFAMVIEVLPEFDELRTVVMSSISGKAGSFDTLYAACKAGTDVAIRRVAASLPPGARLNAVSPGIIADARMTLSRADTEVLEAKRAQTPTRRFTTSRDVACLVYYLLFEAENMQGENINLNGGIFIS
jgi:3-oxoacyl-[acyl-carrier protein] reductase